MWADGWFASAGNCWSSDVPGADVVASSVVYDWSVVEGKIVTSAVADGYFVGAAVAVDISKEGVLVVAVVS